MRQQKLELVDLVRSVVHLLVDLSLFFELDLPHNVLHRFCPAADESVGVGIPENTGVFAVGLHELLETPVLTLPLNYRAVRPRRDQELIVLSPLKIGYLVTMFAEMS